MYRHPAAWLSAHGTFFPDQRFLLRASNIDQDPNTVRTLHTDSSTKDNVLIRVAYTCRQGSSRISKKNTRSRTSPDLDFQGGPREGAESDLREPMWPGKEPSAGEICRSRYNSLLRKHLYRHPAAWLSAHGTFFPDQRFLLRASNIDQDPNTVRTLHTDSSTKDNVLIRVAYTCRQGSSRNSKKNTRSRTSTRPSPGKNAGFSVLELAILVEAACLHVRTFVPEAL